MADAPFETLRSYLTELLRAALRDALARPSRVLLRERLREGVRGEPWERAHPTNRSLMSRP